MDNASKTDLDFLFLNKYVNYASYQICKNKIQKKRSRARKKVFRWKYIDRKQVKFLNRLQVDRIRVMRFKF